MQYSNSKQQAAAAAAAVAAAAGCSGVVAAGSRAVRQLGSGTPLLPSPPTTPYYPLTFSFMQVPKY